nr:Protein phosphatase 1 regulatory subunit 3E [Polyrhizophydium stewartii]
MAALHHHFTVFGPPRPSPTTPRSIKFAETIECICHFNKTDSPKHIAESATIDVHDTGDLDLGSVSSAFALADAWSITSKNMPAHSRFGSLVVVLDHIEIDAPDLLRITVLTRNLAFEKRVMVRYTTDGWASHHDAVAAFQAVVTPTLGDYKGVDRFGITLNLDTEFGPGATNGAIEFAICFTVLGVEHWDNNGTQNYKLNVSRPLLLDAIQQAHKAPPIKSGLAWDDEFSVRLARRRHSFDSSPAATHAVRTAAAATVATATATAAAAAAAATATTTSMQAGPIHGAAAAGSGPPPLPPSGRLVRKSLSSDSIGPAPATPPSFKRSVMLNKPQTPLFLPLDQSSAAASSEMHSSPFIAGSSHSAAEVRDPHPQYAPDVVMSKAQQIQTQTHGQPYPIRPVVSSGSSWTPGSNPLVTPLSTTPPTSQLSQSLAALAGMSSIASSSSPALTSSPSSGTSVSSGGTLSPMMYPDFGIGPTHAHGAMPMPAGSTHSMPACAADPLCIPSQPHQQQHQHTSSIAITAGGGMSTGSAVPATLFGADNTTLSRSPPCRV